MALLKKAQGLPLNTIIIAILGVIVLLVVTAILYTQVTKSGKEIKKVSEVTCPTEQIKLIGECDDIIYGSFSGMPVGKVCCQLKAPAP